MVDVDAALVWRAFNLALSLVALFAMLRLTRRMWSALASRGRLLTQAHCALLLAVTVGAIENTLQHNPTGFRTAVSTAAVVWTLLALFGTRDTLSQRGGS